MRKVSLTKMGRDSTFIEMELVMFAPVIMMVDGRMPNATKHIALSPNVLQNIEKRKDVATYAQVIFY